MQIICSVPKADLLTPHLIPHPAECSADAGNGSTRGSGMEGRGIVMDVNHCPVSRCGMLIRGASCAMSLRARRTTFVFTSRWGRLPCRALGDLPSGAAASPGVRICCPHWCTSPDTRFRRWRIPRPGDGIALAGPATRFARLGYGVDQGCDSRIAPEFVQAAAAAGLDAADRDAQPGADLGVRRGRVL